MRALPLLLLSALFSVTVADKKEVEQWTEIYRQAANQYVTSKSSTRRADLDNALKSLEKKVPTTAKLHWWHIKKNTDKTYYCGGTGGISRLAWMIRFMVQNHPEIKGINPGKLYDGDWGNWSDADTKIAVWNVKTDKDTRKARIVAKFDKSGKLTNYELWYDHKSPLV